MGPGSHSGGMQREGPGPGAIGAKCRRSDFTLVLIQGPSQQPTELIQRKSPETCVTCVRCVCGLCVMCVCTCTPVSMHGLSSHSLNCR